ncbi:ricin-type beta-trefoil lectin protein [Krasilnikovia cinnamomea]|uniref:Ricin-type beta-trefoil lectin protein n=1 Tax=Krasilnikovia cinnamomea TaxID=349313 RepID=A0A4Q7ZLE7_9ACTN|nr:RICIN domain-containing protein [Krasilnikovia cinnamomea]RZU51414.1 ricin-type beta-trefoil lectin protein [Krasilnikovia cinnamomea]
MRLWSGLLMVGLLGASVVPGSAAVAAEPGAGDGARGFVAKVHVGDPSGGGVACTGSLVDPWWVLTAKQCFGAGGQAVNAGAPARATKVTLGGANIARTGPGVVVSVTQVVPHPQRDVVLVKLAAAVDTPPVRVATAAPASGDVLHIAGYGRTRDQWVPDAAHTGQFTVTAVSGPQVEVAAKDDAQPGPCKGDAGGPGLRVSGDLAELVAITTAAGQGGCLGDTGGATGATQTRVDDLAGWIDEQAAAAKVAIVLNDNSQKCLAIPGSSTSNGTHSVQWSCTGGADQDWRLNAVGDGRYEIRNDHSGLCLAIGGGSKEKGAHALQWTCQSGHAEQQWLLDRNARGETRLRNANSGQCLAIGNSAVEDGAHALQWPCTEGKEQKWTVKWRNRGKGVKNAFSSLCAGTGAVTANGAHAVQQACDDANDAEWQLRATTGGYVEIRNDRSGQCLAIGGGSKDDGAHALQWRCQENHGEQQWYVDLDARGLTLLRNRTSDKCLAIVGASKEPGAHLAQFSCDASATDQSWRL